MLIRVKLLLYTCPFSTVTEMKISYPHKKMYTVLCPSAHAGCTHTFILIYLHLAQTEHRQHTDFSFQKMYKYICILVLS